MNNEKNYQSEIKSEEENYDGEYNQNLDDIINETSSKNQRKSSRSTLNPESQDLYRIQEELIEKNLLSFDEHIHIVFDFTNLLHMIKNPFPHKNGNSAIAKFMENLSKVKNFVERRKVRIEQTPIAFNSCVRLLDKWHSEGKIDNNQLNKSIETIQNLIRIHSDVNYEYINLKALRLRPYPKGIYLDDIFNLLFAHEIGVEGVLTSKKHLLENFCRSKKINLIDLGITIYNLESLAEYLIDQNYHSASVFAFSPDGKMVELPKGSTPVDFAYMIHTDVGNYYEQALINGEPVPDDYQLKDMDRVEIIKSTQAYPQRQWLQSVQTDIARTKIEKWYQNYYVKKGKKIIQEIYSKRFLLTGTTFQKVAYLLNCQNVQQLWERLGSGGISEENLKETVDTLIKKMEFFPEIEFNHQSSNQTTSELENCYQFQKIATCCYPFPKTHSRLTGVIQSPKNQQFSLTIHSADCRNITNVPMEKQVNNIKWGSNVCTVSLKITMRDRENMLYNIIHSITQEVKYNIRSLQLKEVKNNGKPQKIAFCVINIQSSSKPQVDYVISELRVNKDILQIQILEITLGTSQYEAIP